MADSDHPAAKAGRFLRAVGRASAATVRELERQAAARPAPPPAPAPAPPPPAFNTSGLLGRTVFVGFVASVVAFVLVAVRVETVFAHTPRLVFRLAAVVVLGFEATLLLSNWKGANQSLRQRVLNRTWGPRGPVTRREKGFSYLIRDALVLIGIAFLAGAVFELLSATVGT